MAGPGEGGMGNPQPGAQHPRMGAGLPSGPGGAAETLKQMASNVGESAGQVKEQVQNLASQAAGRAEEAWEGARQTLRQGASSVAETAQDFWTDSCNLIRRYPVASVAIAFGLGCLATAALGASAWWSQDNMTRRMSRYSA